MSIFQFQLSIDLSVEAHPPEIEITAFLFHYVAVANCGKRIGDDNAGLIGDPPEGGSWIPEVACDFYASAWVGTPEHPLRSSCKLIPPNRYQMVLSLVNIDTPTGPATPSPYLRGGEYALSSIQIVTKSGTQLLLPPYKGFMPDTITIPDRTKESAKAIKISELQVRFIPVSQP